MVIAKQTKNNLLCCFVFTYEDAYMCFDMYEEPLLLFKNKQQSEEYSRQQVLDYVYFDDYNEFIK